MRTKNKQSILLSCVIFYVLNQPRFEVEANNNTTVVTDSNASFSTLNNTMVFNSNATLVVNTNHPIIDSNNTSNVHFFNNATITSLDKTPAPSATNAIDFSMLITINNSDTAGDSTLFAVGTTPPPIIESKNQTTKTAIVDNVKMYGNTKHNTSMSTSGDTFIAVSTNNIFGSVAINISRQMFNHTVGISLEIPMIIEGSASMRLKSSDENDMNNTVLQWYTYCSEYVSNVWHEAGYDQSPLVLSFDKMIQFTTTYAVD